ncbi:MAG: beta-lactamase, partial [Frankiales bacterium]|nr:beta-lactamase [Frankiales bacterium]
MSTLQEFVEDKAAELGVPGAIAGVLVDGEEHTAFTGVTSVENPLPVDASTLFQFGSTGKTYTATAVMRLVDQGVLELDAPVRRYLPDLVLRDEQAAAEVTVLQLLNHTAGWEGDAIVDTGDGDDALATYVRGMADLQQVSPLGTDVSYNNASLSLAGHLLARVLDTTYEKAVQDLLLDPLGMSMTFFRPGDVISRRFAVGHTQHDDGRVSVARPWAMPRSAAPAGGMVANLADQLTWARFHLGDGTAADGTRVLPAELLARMQEPTVATPGSALGDAVGISWLLKDLGGTLQVGHGGTTNGQHSDFALVPSRSFAVTCLSNCGPNGPQLNHAVTTWALEHFLGLRAETLVATPRTDDELAAYTGSYETVAVDVVVTAVAGGLSVAVEMKPETRAQLSEAGEDTDVDQPPIQLGLVAGGDQYVVTEGPAAGMRGYFTRDADGRVDRVHLGGRLASRT